jgi:nucleoside-diphosphate-sugar epimerase
MRGGPVVVNNGAPFRSYLYAADLAVWLWTILFKGTPARPFNVGSDEALGIAALARMIGEMFGVPVSVADPLPGAVPPRYVPSTQRAQSELGLHAWTGLRSAIEKTAQWHRA